jgi:uncharacterized protein YigE (DUF2233 family)
MSLTTLLIAALAQASACETVAFESTDFSVCVFDPERHEFALVLEGDDGERIGRMNRLPTALGEAAAEVRFAMNAGMFSPEGGPIGLYVEDGSERQRINTREGPGNFHLLPNGVFSIDTDGAVRVETAQAYLDRGGESRWATQSGPMLVIDGALHPRISQDGPSRRVRNGVGVCEDGLTRFVISELAVSFGRLARLYRDQLDCPDALYLDGAVSSLWDPGAGRMDAVFRIGPILVVSSRDD